jgi:hypothetical protein
VATAGNWLARLRRAWKALDSDQRRAAIAAVALLLTMFLPWYEKNAVVGSGFASDSVSAFGTISFIEAAIFLVSLGVLLLMFFRGEHRAFHLPGGDGTVIFGAGLWAAFLLFWRVFDKPNIEGETGATVGIQWGFFLAFIAAGALAVVGFRIRAAHRAEPTRVEDPTAVVEPTPPPPRREVAPPPRRRRKPSGPDAPTQIAGQLSFDENDETRKQG